jgi:hypothetical protein
MVKNISKLIEFKKDLKKEQIENSDDQFKSKNINRLIDSKIINIVIIAVMAALGISTSYLLAPLVNIELMSFIIFISGYLYGIIVGLGVGAISSMIFYGWNPFGVSIPQIYLACVLGMILFGVFGGLLGNYNNKKENVSNSNNNQNSQLKFSAWNVYKFGFSGLILTLLFDIVTNIVSGYVFYGGNIMAGIILGLPYLLIHTISNTIVFAIVTIPLYNSISKIKKIRI